MASKAETRAHDESRDLGEEVDSLEKLIERTKVLYEQYFLGIQKLPPLQLHREVERKFRELTQRQGRIKNAGLRYRVTNLGQKFGSYNSYWRRTMRQIENGTYIRDVARVGRRSARSGKEIPQEILNAMPKRMREKILRDRERMAKRQAKKGAAPQADAPQKKRSTVHEISEDDALLGGDFDIDALFEEMTAPAEPTVGEAPSPPPAAKVAKPSPPRKPPPARKPVRKPEGSRPKPTPESLPQGMSERQSRELYKRYVRAREIVGDTSEASYDNLMKTLRKQAPKIMKEHGASRVDFNVVIKGKKVVLKAKPIK